jgi:hypothetical protein
MREAGDDLAAGLPGVGVVPAPKGVCLYPAYAARRAAEIEGYAVDHQHDETPFPPIR